MMREFATEHKRAIAIELVASGKCPAGQWAILSQVVRNDSLGLLPDGTLVARARPPRKRKRVVSIHEAAGVAGVHPATVRRWIREGKLAPCGEKQLPLSVLREDLERLLAARS
ncbi:MAG: helix-turn-helix domain-containing protein [Armatimonadetes bacterium]|nr:helix-turn-helix domain-containing protein [Armatimonadota bacterium]